MGILNWFFGNPQKGDLEAQVETNVPSAEEVPPSKDLFMSDLSQPMDSDLAESYRINEIMSLINTNWAEIGYRDALANHDRAFMHKNIDRAIFEIKSKITDALRLFSISVLASQHAQQLSIDAGLMDTASESALRIEQTEKNKAYLVDLMSELERREGVFIMVQSSYEHGFVRGIDAMIHSKFLDTPLP
ncbi:MAG: hypothetical protein ACKN9J_04720 [Holophagaceae bacterium]